MRCFRCHRFRHGRDKCNAREELCVKCGEPGHRGEECKKELRCLNCKGEHLANSKSCPKYMEEQGILRYRAHNGGTFGQARAAVVVEVAKEVRPKLYAQAVRGGPARKVTAPVSTQNKIESLPVARNSTTRRASLTNNKPRTEETRNPQTYDRYGTDPGVNLESIHSIWSLPKDSCRADRRAVPSFPVAPPPSQSPPRAPAPEDSDSGDMDTDLEPALSADPGGCPLSPLVLIKAKWPPSPGPAKAAGGKRYKGLA
ncbi:nucleic-acid-binding protein from mobile element jockey [Elysia marginata]|uniref:Nucleic-acid-binding protein from mobile element jockey n=1 Tax=Elysia marginata TaxID=1093978 RepID=A0AAV4K3L1_9GAST|nr:nucleic-acid-binding protein from mobile element jockey [Elysia marginata]